MSRLADKCGLQEEMGWPFACTGSDTRQIFGMSTNRDRADLTLALVALTSQTLPWTINVVNGGNPYYMHRANFVRYHGCSVLQVHKSATTVEQFVNVIKGTGIPISVRDIYSVGVVDCAPFYPHMDGVPKSERQAWYESMKYHHILKTVMSIGRSLPGVGGIQDTRAETARNKHSQAWTGPHSCSNQPLCASAETCIRSVNDSV